MSGPAVATSDEESVGSCGPPTPHTPPAPSSTPRGAPVRRQLDFTGGGDLEDDVDDEFLCRVADDIERGYGEAKRRAPPCVCGRGVCAVEWDGRSGRWKYVCPSRPKCNHVVLCEEVDLNPESQPTSRSHPKPISPCTFNDSSNHIAGPRTSVNTRTQVTDITTPVIVYPQVAGATTLFSDSPPAVGATTPAKFNPQGAVAVTTMPATFIQQGAVATTPAKVSPQVAGAATLFSDNPPAVGATTLAKFIPQGVVAATPAKVSPQGAKTSNGIPVCQCTAGKCRRTRIGDEDWYVCPIQKRKGACSYRVPVSDFVKDVVPSAQAIPCGEVHPESPTVPHRPIAAVNTPSKSPMRPYGTPSPISPISNNACFSCKEEGHGMKD